MRRCRKEDIMTEKVRRTPAKLHQLVNQSMIMRLILKEPRLMSL